MNKLFISHISYSKHNLPTKIEFNHKEQNKLLVSKYGEFDSNEAYGKYMDEMMNSEWWAGLSKFLEDEYPDLKTLGTDVYYNAI